MTILVTGTTANIGRKVVDHLLAMGAGEVRALTTNPARAALPEGVEVAKGYLRRLETLPAALDGVDRMYLAPTPDTVTEVLALARDAGVRHVVDLSGEPESWWGQVNDAVEASGLEWTHLWPADFMENSTMWARQIRETGTVREPYPDSASAPIAMDDIAAVAATALLGEGHTGRAYPLGGPETLTRFELLRTLGEALGRDLRFRTVPPAEAAEALRPDMGDTADWYVENVLTGFTENPVLPTSSVQDITGRPGTTFARWAAAHTAEFRD
ncbi:hydroxylase [Amycolatopsis antarctica]|uniref:Hydroxylase n=1 Tax=Amycolatopsis antarctica TaxID=1854586 RepID=A0A263CWR8_9PSEU|nr:NAD(P)H-binding protein [Amycolatopsis antarctica]OZM70590.1 hydroxylase [Amycolatopsis antarctica]